MPGSGHKDAMNQLNVSLQHSILALAAHGWSRRRIARELAIDRETVGKYLDDPCRLANTPGMRNGPRLGESCLAAG